MAEPLRVSEDNTRYFTNHTGRAIYLTGSHTWLDLQDNQWHAFDYEAFLDFLQQHNHNFFRLWIWESASWVLPDSQVYRLKPLPFERTGPGNALDGLPKFDLSKFNKAYFGRLRQRLLMAQERGIYVGVMLFQGFSVGKKNSRRKISPWAGHPFHRENNINGINGDTDGDGEGYGVHTLANREITRIQEAYVRKVIDTANDLDNVIYEISNESHGASRDWQYHFIHYIRRYEQSKPKQHPVWMSFTWDGITNSGSDADLFNGPAEVISPVGGKRRLYRNDPPAAEGSKVIILDTDHLWGIGGDASWVWKSFLRGLNPIFMDPYKKSPHNLSLTLSEKWEPIRKAMGYTATFANKIDLLKMTPRGGLASTGYCLANPGKEYLVYQPEPNQPFEVAVIPGAYQYQWFDPENGEIREAGTLNASHVKQIFIPPVAGDAVLYLKE